MRKQLHNVAPTVAFVAGFFVFTMALSLGNDPVRAQGEGVYRVKITNVTNAQSFTPTLAVTHSAAVRTFAAGTAATPELKAQAESGATGPLAALMASTAGVGDIVMTEGLLTRGVTTEFEITGSPGERLSLTAMLIPTNDAFFGVNTALPAYGEVKVVGANAYDAGTEKNDELCASIPGPSFTECGGPGGGAEVGGGEGAVTIHRGIQGVGDFDASVRDWRNPVARVTIRKIS